MEAEGDQRLQVFLDLLDWAKETIEALDFGGPVRVTHCQSMTLFPSYTPQLNPHADLHSGGVMFTLTIRTGPGARFRIGGKAETGRGFDFDESAVDLDMQPGELWAWNYWEVHSATNTGPGNRDYLLLRATHDGSSPFEFASTL